MPQHKVAVIGAGPCGLAVGKTLAEFGLEYDCLEAGNRPGGLWNVEEGGGGYRSLSSNTSNPNMAYSDFPFEQSEPTYLTAADMVRYFNRYANHFSLLNRIEFGRRVEQARRLDNGAWRLTLDGAETREYTALVIAAGQYSSPHRPHDTYPGHFSGESLHVYDYYDIQEPLDLRGKRVMVIGLGTSAAEVAAELANPNASAGCAEQVILSARSGRWVVPKLSEGPMDSSTPHVSVRPPFAFRVLPDGLSHWLTRRMMGKGMRRFVSSFGGASALGLPEPSIEPWQERPTLSFDFISMLKAGRIEVRPGIDRFDDKTVHFSDGTHTEADVILYATGYELSFPFLESETLGTNANDLSLYRHISHCVHDNLFFIGYCRVMCALWPVAEQQSRWLARLLTGQFTLPQANKRSRSAVSLRHSLPIMCSLYVEALRREAGGL